MSRSAARWPERVRAAFSEAFGNSATVDDGFGPISVDVPLDRWLEAVEVARNGLDCRFFDWLSAVDELTDGFRLVCHLVDHRPGGTDHLLIRSLVPRDGGAVPSIAHLYGGARWHERETHEMFGVDFTAEGQPLELEKLLLAENFEGHPLRKDFVLASRVAKPWPGAKEPGESDHDAAPSRRRMRPPGVPEPEQWGPREPGSDKPDTLAAAGEGPASRPRRTPRATPPGGGAGRDRAGSAGAASDRARPERGPGAGRDRAGSAGAGSDRGGGAAVDGPGRPATEERGRMDAPPSGGEPDPADPTPSDPGRTRPEGDGERGDGDG